MVSTPFKFVVVVVVVVVSKLVKSKSPKVNPVSMIGEAFGIGGAVVIWVNFGFGKGTVWTFVCVTFVCILGVVLYSLITFPTL